MHLETRRDPILLVLRDDLSPEDTAMLQALYSRSSASVLIHLAKIDAGRRDAVRAALIQHVGDVGPDLADDLIAAVLGQGASARAGSLMRNHYVGYNHKSIGDCGTTTLFIENVSLLAAKAIQDNPLYNGQETSTRYIDFTGRHVVDPVGTPASRAIHDRWMNFYTALQKPVAEHVRATYPRLSGEPEDVYEKAVLARTFDITRGYLPAGATTQLSWHTNLRQAGDKLGWLRHHPADEMRTIAVCLHELLREAYPSSVGSIGGAKVSGVVGSESAYSREAWEADTMCDFAAYPPPSVPQMFETTVRADRPPSPVVASLIRDRPRGCVLPHVLADLGQVTFRGYLDFGSFRDAQRHRNGVCRMPLLTTQIDFEPWYLTSLPTQWKWRALDMLVEQEAAIVRLDGSPVDKQYYVALGYRVPYQMTYGLPAAVYMQEIRAGKMVHPTLRRAVHGMIADFRTAFPAIPLHVDLDSDDWDVRRGTQTITGLSQ